MGKRSNFERRARDLYPTPEKAVLPLVPHLEVGQTFDEPLAGDGRLVNALISHGLVCIGASDIEPGRSDIKRLDVFDKKDTRADLIITNTPWPHPGQRGDPAIAMALHLSEMAPTWLLLPADLMHNAYFDRIGDRCAKIVAVGRVSWMDNGVSGFDNAAWYLITKHCYTRPQFYWREAA